eukprot:2962299-Lingulodinium_polyedra.AAC.1
MRGQPRRPSALPHLLVKRPVALRLLLLLLPGATHVESAACGNCCAQRLLLNGRRGGVWGRGRLGGGGSVGLPCACLAA